MKEGSKEFTTNWKSIESIVLLVTVAAFVYDLPAVVDAITNQVSYVVVAIAPLQLGHALVVLQSFAS